jgi:hypothetical protein
MSLNPLRALGVVHHVVVHHVTVSSKVSMCEVQCQQSHGMRGVTWLCEISLTPAGPQCAGIPTPPGPWPPPPPRGAGAVVAIPEEGRIRERKPTRQLPLQALPIPWTVGGILPWGEVSPLGEGQTGRGQKAPSPVYFQYDGKGREEGQKHPRGSPNFR